jgi:hypothetical protein
MKSPGEMGAEGNASLMLSRLCGTIKLPRNVRLNDLSVTVK